jgi:hypothetical protein
VKRKVKHSFHGDKTPAPQIFSNLKSLSSPTCNMGGGPGPDHDRQRKYTSDFSKIYIKKYLHIAHDQGASGKGHFLL